MKPKKVKEVSIEYLIHQINQQESKERLEQKEKEKNINNRDKFKIFFD